MRKATARNISLRLHGLTVKRSSAVGAKKRMLRYPYSGHRVIFELDSCPLYAGCCQDIV